MNLNRLKELTCDDCGGHLGFVDEFDMNETYVFCDNCVRNAQTTAGEQVVGVETKKDK